MNNVTSVKPRLFWDTRADRPNEITSFAHCAQCHRELPAGESMESWARINAGIQADGSFQVWCVRHGLNILILSAKPAEGVEYEDKPTDPRTLCEHPDHDA